MTYKDKASCDSTPPCMDLGHIHVDYMAIQLYHHHWDSTWEAMNLGCIHVDYMARYDLTHCNTLQHTSAHCTTKYRIHVQLRCDALQHTAAHRNTLLHKTSYSCASTVHPTLWPGLWLIFAGLFPPKSHAISSEFPERISG